ncbi:hypothetical protein [Amycolatopsis pigmentata]|uniref:Helix-turn-helix domain-containing protein n=1 Tax=Amycolatopsis pigmentata TaxID=450801 RepID=A0ABW5G4T9_9PSEU
MSSQPAGRFEWERIVRRIVMPERVKFLALLLATFADGDGSRIRPGGDVLTAMVGKSKATLKRAMSVLRDELGLIEEVSHGGRGRASEYRLVVPEDLLERAELLDPDGKRRPNKAHLDEPSSNETRLTLVSSESTDTPVDNSETGLTQMSPDSTDPPTELGSNTAISERTGLIFDRTGLTQDEPPPLLNTNHQRGPHQTTPDVTTTSARDGKCEHGFKLVNRDDGRPSCVFCRRATPTAKEAS